jgi:diadenosine tetraphosphate (Ap4A) HIT family hydrolase
MKLPLGAGSAREHCRLCTLGPDELVVAANDEAFAIPSYGGFIEGWTLVVPRHHIPNSASASPESAKLLDDLVDEMIGRVRDAYGDVVVFEHGAATMGRPASCGVDHAHIHVVPARTTDLRALVSDEAVQPYRWTPHTRPWLGAGIATASDDYIWIADETGSWVARTPDLPSQLVRKALAKAVSVPIWNWRDDHCIEAYQATAAKLARSVSG